MNKTDVGKRFEYIFLASGVVSWSFATEAGLGESNALIACNSSRRSYTRCANRPGDLELSLVRLRLRGCGAMMLPHHR